MQVWKRGRKTNKSAPDTKETTLQLFILFSYGQNKHFKIKKWDYGHSIIYQLALDYYYSLLILVAIFKLSEYISLYAFCVWNQKLLFATDNH